MSNSKQEFSAGFAAADRYAPPREPGQAGTKVTVDGMVYDGTILGRNGPRVQVRFTMDGRSYVRWFDRADLVTGSSESVSAP